MAVPTKTQLSNFLGTSGEDYFEGNLKSLNFYSLVIWWGKPTLTSTKWQDFLPLILGAWDGIETTLACQQRGLRILLEEMQKTLATYP